MEIVIHLVCAAHDTIGSEGSDGDHSSAETDIAVNARALACGGARNVELGHEHSAGSLLCSCACLVDCLLFSADIVPIKLTTHREAENICNAFFVELLVAGQTLAVVVAGLIDELCGA